jgi:NDP-sugar pyrophosphorylase family protein
MDCSAGESTQGIVLAGSFPWSDLPLDRLLPRPLVPVAHQPLIAYTLRWLRQGRVPEVVVCLNAASRPVRHALAEVGAEFLGLDFYEDVLPRGPAGCARDVALAGSAETFVVADAAAIPMVGLVDVLQTHRASGAVATVVVQREPPRDGGSDRSRPVGIYIFDRRALERVPGKGFQDIKENLIPQLYRAGEHVSAHVISGDSPRVLGAQTYLEVNHWAVMRLIEQSVAPEGYVRRDDALIHASASVDAGAQMMGPILIGPDSKVLPGATLVGPMVLGTACTVALDAIVSRTVAWNRCRVSARSVVDACVLADDAIVPPNSCLRGEIRSAADRAERRPRLLGARVRNIPPFGLWPRPEPR